MDVTGRIECPVREYPDRVFFYARPGYEKNGAGILFRLRIGRRILFELFADALVGVRYFAGAIFFDHLAVIIPGSIVMDIQFA